MTPKELLVLYGYKPLLLPGFPGPFQSCQVKSCHNEARRGLNYCSACEKSAGNSRRR